MERHADKDLPSHNVRRSRGASVVELLRHPSFFQYSRYTLYMYGSDGACV